MSAESLTTSSGRRNWRRRWKRSPAERRLEAAAALGDVFRRRRLGGLTPLFLLLSLAAHVPAALFLKTGREGMDIETAGQAESYLRQVIQKERATSVSRDLSRRITMPPPPPEPEAVVNTTLSAEITTNIQRVIGDTLDVKVSSALAKEVATSLRDELAEAARSVADGKLSPEEIKALREQFTRKAHRNTVRALRRYREKTQVARAKLSVKEWYERKLSKTVRGRLEFELFSSGHRAWSRYGGGDWGFLDERGYREKVDRLRELVGGEHYGPHSGVGGRPTMHNRRLLPDWPKPTRKQAEALLTILGTIFQRHQRGWMPTWDEAVAQYVDDFYPHRREAVRAAHVKPLSVLWGKVFDQAEEFRRVTEDGADPQAPARAQRDCLATVKALRDAAAALFVAGQRDRDLRAVNRALRSRVLRGPARRQEYKRFVDRLVEVLAPAVRDMAQNEFGEGIIIRQKGIDTVAAEFASEILAYLRRDVEKTFPRPRFDVRVFDAHRNPYRSKVTGGSCPPSAKDIAADEAALGRITAGWSEADKAYLPRRAEVVAGQFQRAVDRVLEGLLSKIVDEGRLAGRSYGCPPSLCFYAGIESVDYTDKVAQRLNARARALAGRGQDMARLTDEGVPDTSAPMIALMLGAGRGHGASLEPILATMAPGHVTGALPAGAVRAAAPRLPPLPAGWGRVTQPEVNPPFQTFRCEGIPFLANFPRINGDLTDWGKIRPLITQRVQHQGGTDETILIYAAWNYQGFFFGYHVTQPAVKWAYPRTWYGYEERTGVIPRSAPDYHWAYGGEFLRLLFDTLDARGRWRGEPHGQEFVIFPRGTERHPNIPGIERIIKATRDVKRRRMDGRSKAQTRIFPPQAPGGPDGTGPYRVTSFDPDGYTTEVFLPRSLFNVPVFCPGWYIGFEVIVGTQRQPRYNCAVHGRVWANPRWHGHGDLGDKDHPDDWGDLLLLGTDPRLAVQNADRRGTLSTAIVPGHSCLLTVIDPDRNVHLTGKDTVVVSAEVSGSAAGAPAGCGDVEVFLLTETGKNTSVFRGYVDTQPGRGREVQGVIEVMPGQEVRFGYVDLANAEGERNVIYHLNLPVVAGITIARSVGR